MEKINVGIIGSGLSGLTAAYELYRQLGSKVNITIIEQENQTGGRIFTKKFNECPIELGAQFFIHKGQVYNLLQSLNLEQDACSLRDNFISIHYKEKILNIGQLETSGLFTKEELIEMKKVLKYAIDVEPNQKLISTSFKNWHQENIGGLLISFWNRLLLSIGVRDIKYIHAYFGLILINVFFGKNYLLKSGLQELINKLSEKIKEHGGKIIKSAKCNSINKINNTYCIKYEKNEETKEMVFDRIISTIKPKDLAEIWNIDTLMEKLKKIEGHSMALYVIQTNVDLWDKTWGIIISKDKSPIYALCDWKNVISANRNTPILAICSPYASTNEIVSELKNIFPKHKLQCNIIFEKKWTVGLHQPNVQSYQICKSISKELPNGFYMAGDWTIIPALEGAVVSGIKSAKLLINEIS